MVELFAALGHDGLSEVPKVREAFEDAGVPINPTQALSAFYDAVIKASDQEMADALSAGAVNARGTLLSQLAASSSSLTAATMALNTFAISQRFTFVLNARKRLERVSPLQDVYFGLLCFMPDSCDPSSMRTQH